jgi:O-antigen ligase
MNFAILFIIASTLFALTYIFYFDFKRGINISVFLFIFFSPAIAIETGGGLPKFTIHRLILILLFIVWVVKFRPTLKEISKIPFIFLLALIAVTNFISLWISVDFGFSLKGYLSFTLEIFIFYIIIASSIADENDILKVLKSIILSLTLVAVFAVIEKYTRFNPLNLILLVRERPLAAMNDVLSTFPHRILLGTALAMGWPLVFGLTNYFKDSHLKKILLWGSIILLLSGCYFSNSRGPWLAIIISGALILFFSSSKTKMKIFLICGFVMIGLLLSPGVWETISGRATATLEQGTFKGNTYQYRWELWRIAYDKISESNIKTFFGFGPGTHEVMEIFGTLSYSGQEHEFGSWDNHYAAELLETGLIGLALLLILDFSILREFYRALKKSVLPDKDILTGIIASIIVMIFMKTNVQIFAPQLNYLFWTLVALGAAMAKCINFEFEDSESEVEE